MEETKNYHQSPSVWGSTQDLASWGIDEHEKGEGISPKLHGRNLSMISRQLGPQSPRKPLVTHYACWVCAYPLCFVFPLPFLFCLFCLSAGRGWIIWWSLHLLPLPPAADLLDYHYSPPPVFKPGLIIQSSPVRQLLCVSHFVSCSSASASSFPAFLVPALCSSVRLPHPRPPRTVFSFFILWIK